MGCKIFLLSNLNIKCLEFETTVLEVEITYNNFYIFSFLKEINMRDILKCFIMNENIRRMWHINVRFHLKNSELRMKVQNN